MAVRWVILFFDLAYLGAMAWYANPVGAVLGGIASIITVLSLHQLWKMKHGRA